MCLDILAGQWEYILRLFLSALFGALIGLEREFRLKEAGVRTHLIVSFAACLMMLVSKYGFNDLLGHSAIGLDPSRVAASIVTGISFLGAGIIFTRDKGISGLTTAAGAWATVGIGMATGAGMYLLSTFSTLFIVIIQALLHLNVPLLYHPGAVLMVRLSEDPDAADRLNAALKELQLLPDSVKYNRTDGALTAELILERLPCAPEELGSLLTPLMKEPYIRSMQWWQ